MENITSQKPTSKIENSESLKDVIIAMVKAMQADYGRAFQNQFHDEEALRDFKNRLLSKLRGIPNCFIISGYELAIARSPKFVPTIPEILANVLAAEKEAKRIEKNRLDVVRVVTLPPPAITCNPLAMLKEAMQKIATEEAIMSKKQKRECHLARLKAHAALMAAHVGKIKYNAMDHLCSIAFCGNVGTLSHGVLGGCNFYCAKHFRMEL